ncbi:hypothetical protein RI367_003984 [Sorochytrium milnesiophthora]
MLQELPFGTQTLKPSEHIRDYGLSWTEKLAQVAAATAGSLPSIVSTGVNVFDDSKAARESTVPDNKALFMSVPAMVHFQNYEPFKTYECPVTFRNIDKLPRRIRVDPINDPHFEIVSWKSLPQTQRKAHATAHVAASDAQVKVPQRQSAGDARVAAGMDVPFVLSFTPDEARDYHCNIVCHTERETFVVPVCAIGPRGMPNSLLHKSKALILCTVAVLDLPDEINFSVIPVRHTTTRTLLLRNIGSRDAKFVTSILMSSAASDDDDNAADNAFAARRSYGQLSSMPTKRAPLANPYTIKPSSGFVPVGQSMQLNVECFAKQGQLYPGALIVHYDTGERISIDLFAEAEDVDVRLERQQLRMDSTYLTKCSFKTVRILNRSDILVSYSWKMFSSERDEVSYRVRRKHLTTADEEDAIAQSPTTDSALISQAYENKRQEIDRDPLLFADAVFSVEPIQGQIWPHSHVDITVQFQPDRPGPHSKSAFCEVAGRESRLPIQLCGESIGPRVRFSYDLLEIDSVFVNSEHVYEVLLENVGEISATYAVCPRQTLFGPRFQFEPDQGVLDPGARRLIRIRFAPVLLGDFFEEFSWDIQGALAPLRLSFRGRVIGPTFQFDVSALDFGHCSLGFRHRNSFGVINTSEIPMSFHLRVVDVTTSQTPVEGSESRDEFELHPASGTIPPRGCQIVTVDFTPKELKVYEQALTVDVESVGANVFTLPVTATCAVPDAYLAEALLDLQDCYLGIPYEREITLINPDPLTARYQLHVTQNYVDDVSITFPVAQGIIEPSATMTVPLVITVNSLGSREETVTLRVHGRDAHEALSITVKTAGIGPHIYPPPSKLQWGTVPVLQDQPQTITLQNESPIVAPFTCQIENSPHSVFTVQPSQSVIPPNSSTELVVVARLDDSVKFADTLDIAIKGGQTHQIALSAKGQGTTITYDEGLRSINFHNVFTNQLVTKQFAVTNRGRRTQIVFWASSGNLYGTKAQDSTSPAPPFEVTPQRFTLKPGHHETITLRCLSTRAQTVRDTFLCQCTIESDPTRRLVVESKITANFIDPMLQFQPSSLRFLYSHASEGPMEPISHELEVRNTTDLPVDITLRTAAPFRVLGLPRLHLSPNETVIVGVQLDASHFSNRISSFDKGRLTVLYDNHPQKDQVELFADVRFPNVEFSVPAIEFGTLSCHEERRVTFHIKNIGQMTVCYSWWTMVDDDMMTSTGGVKGALLEVIPARGIIKPGCSIRAEALLVGTDKVQLYKATAICDIQGGPKYGLTVTANISANSYSVDKTLIDFGIRPYQDICESEVTLTNEGNTVLPFHVVPFENFEDNYRLHVSPGSGEVQPFGVQRFVIRLCPALPQIVHTQLLIRVGNNKAETIHLRCHGQAPLLRIDLPRDVDPDYDAAVKELTSNMAIVCGASELRDSLTPEAIERRVLLIKCHRLLQSLIKECNVSTAYVGSQAINKILSRAKGRPVLDKELAKIVLATHVCDFGNIIRGGTIQRSFAVGNISSSSLSFSVPKTSLAEIGFSVLPERVKGLPPASESSEKLEMAVSLSIGAEQDVSKLSQVRLPISIQGGPSIEILLRATITTPEIELLQKSVDFGTVTCGMRKSVAIVIANSQSVACTWSVRLPQVGSRKTSRPASQPTSALTRKTGTLQQADLTEAPVFTVTPTSGHLEPEQEVILYVRFQPSDSKPYEDKVMIDVAMNPQPYVIPVHGLGAFLGVEFRPTTADFGTVQPFTDAAECRVTMANPSSEAIEVYSVDFDPIHREEDKQLLSLSVGYERDFLYLPLRQPGSKWALPASRPVSGMSNATDPHGSRAIAGITEEPDGPNDDANDTAGQVGELLGDKQPSLSNQLDTQDNAAGDDATDSKESPLLPVLVLHGPPLSGRSSIAQAVVAKYPGTIIFRVDNAINQLLAMSPDNAEARELAETIHDTVPAAQSPSDLSPPPQPPPASSSPGVNSNSGTTGAAGPGSMSTTGSANMHTAHSYGANHDSESRIPPAGGDHGELAENAKVFTASLVAAVVKFFLAHMTGSSADFVVDGLESKYCRSPAIVLQGLLQALEGRRIIFIHLSLEASLVHQREVQRKRLEHEREIDLLPRVTPIAEEDYDSLSPDLKRQYDLAVKRYKDAFRDLRDKRISEKRRLEEEIALRIGEKKLEEEKNKRRDKNKKTQNKPIVQQVDKDKSMASLSSRDFRNSPKSGVSSDKILAGTRKERDRTEPEGEPMAEIPPDMLLSEPSYRAYEAYQATVDSIMQQAKEAEKQAAKAPAADKKRLKDADYDPHAADEPMMQVQEMAGVQPQEQLIDNVIALLPSVQVTHVAPKHASVEGLVVVEHAVRRPTARSTQPPSGLPFALVPYKTPKEGNDDAPPPPPEPLQISLPRESKKQSRSVKVQEEVKPEIEVVETAEPEKFRWVIPANGQQDFAVRFHPTKVGLCELDLTFEVVGAVGNYHLPCRGVCQFPRLEGETKKIFSKVKKRKADQDTLATGEFILEDAKFYYGPLLVTHAKDKYVDKFLEHRALLSMVNVSALEVRASFIFTADTKGDCFFVDPPTVELAPGQSQSLSVWAFPRTTGTQEDTLVCCIKDNPEPLTWTFACIGVRPDLELEKKHIAFERILVGKTDVRELRMRNTALIPVAWKLLGTDGLNEEVHISPLDGVVAAMASQDITFRFAAAKPTTVKRTVKIEYTDIERTSGQASSESIQITAEAYDVAMDVGFPRGSEGNLDFGILRVFEEGKQTLHIKNKGKYELNFRFSFDVPDAAQCFTITPQQGIVQPGEKPFAIQVVFCAPKEVQFSDVTVVRCLAFDPVNNETITAVPIRAVAKAVYSKFSVLPARDLNFGCLVVGTKATRSLVLENTGEFDWRFSLYKITDTAHEHRGTITGAAVAAAAAATNAVAGAAVATNKGRGAPRDKAGAPAAQGPAGAGSGVVGGGASSTVGGSYAATVASGGGTAATAGAAANASFGAGNAPASTLTAAANVALQTSGTAAGGGTNPSNAVGGAGKAASKVVRQADALGGSSAFSATPMSGTISAGSKHTIVVEYHPETVGTADELIGIDISDRDPQTADLIEYRFMGESCLPGINTADTQSIFEDYTVAKRLELYGEQTMVYTEEDHVFYFGAFITGQDIQARFKLTNPHKVQAELTVVAKPRSKVTRGEVSDFAFEVHPTQVTVPSHDYRYVVVTFHPTSIQAYTGLFEVTVDNAPSGAPKELAFELRGEGTLPRVVIEKPVARSKSGAAVVNFRRLLLGTSQTQTVSIRNDGIISAKCGLEWVSREGDQFTCADVDETFVLKPQASQTMAFTCRPTEPRVLEAEMRLKVIDNPFETNTIQLLGEGFVDNVTFENFPDDLENEIGFGPCLVGETVTKHFTVTNRAAFSIRVATEEQKAVTVSPMCFHLRSGRSKIVTVTYSPAAPAPDTELTLRYKLLGITYKEHAADIDWDDRSTSVHWTAANDRNYQPTAAVTTAQPAAAAAALKRVYETTPEPAYDVLGTALKDKTVSVTFGADYPQYECSVAEVRFRDTMMFQTRVYRFQLHNTGRVRLEYHFRLQSSTPGAPATTADEGDDAAACPFVVEPATGVIAEGDFATVSVKFSPEDDQSFVYTMIGSFLRMRESRDLTIALSGAGLRPFCHFELPDSDYLTGDRRSPEAASKLKVESGTRVIEFSSCGVKTKNLKRFFVVNPTDLAYSFEWQPRSVAPGVRDKLFQCNTARGTLQSGKRFEVVFEFTPETTDTVESLWTFAVPDHGIKVPFLLVGHALEPNVFLDRNSIVFRPVLVGKSVKETVLLTNDEDVAFPFAFSQTQFETDSEGKPVMRFQPSSGTIAPKSELPIEITFQPIAERPFNFNLVCNVRRKQSPLLINIKGEGYQIHESLQAEMTDGSLVDLAPANQGDNAVDFGAVHINEHRIKRFVLFNKGKVNLDFVWKIVPAHPYVRILPDMGTVSKEEKLAMDLSYLPMIPGQLPSLKAMCKIANGKSYTLSITGSAVKPLLKFSRTKVTFNTLYVGRQTAEATTAHVTVSNDDSKAISLDLSSSNPSVVDVDAGPFNLQPRESLDIVIRFKADEVGQYNEAVTVNVNGVTKVDVTVQCTVVDFKVELLAPDQSVVNFGALRAGQQAARTLKLINRASIPASFSIGPPGAVERLLRQHRVKISPSGPYSLNAKSMLPLQLVFEPVARLPAFSEELVIESASITTPLCLVNGACQGKEVKLESDTIPFGAVVYQSSTVRKIQLQNVGDIGAKFMWRTSQFAPDFSISPSEGYVPASMETPLEITFHPRQVSPDIRYENLICEVEGHTPLKLTLTGICIPQPAQTELIKFSTPARHPDVKSITLTNKTNVGWYIRPIIENPAWSGPDVVSVEAGSSAQYDLKFEPLEMAGHGENGRHEGSAFFPLPDGSGLLYRLSGVVDKPLPAGTFARELAAKMSITEILPVTNWLKRPQRFRVIMEQQKSDPAVTLKGHDYIDVPGLLTRDYKLTFFSYKEGLFAVKVIFRNEQTQEYLFYNLTFKVTAAGVLSTIDMVTTVRETCVKEIALSNPLNVPVSFATSCTLPDVTVPHNVVVPPRSESVCPIEFLALVPRETTGKLTLTSSELGVFQYDIHLNAVAAGYERTMHFKVGLGGVQVLTFRFPNLCRSKTEFSCKVENTDFSVEKSVTVMPSTGSGAEVNVDVTFEPSKLGDVRTYLAITSQNSGDYTVPLHGYCTTPRPQGPISIKSGTTAAVPFKNVFNQQATFSFSIDNPNFTVKAAETIASKKTINMNIGYKVPGGSGGGSEKEKPERSERDKDRDPKDKSSTSRSVGATSNTSGATSNAANAASPAGSSATASGGTAAANAAAVAAAAAAAANSKVSKLTVSHPSGISWVYYLKGLV